MCGTKKNSAIATQCTKMASLSTTAHEQPSAVINLDHGDPTAFETYWRKKGDKCMVSISGSELMSYLSDTSKVCWFLLPELEDSIRGLHRVVGNAVLDGRHVVVGTGSTQLYQAALYALTTPGGSKPVIVVAAAPYYSSYPDETDYLRSSLFKWGGDANAYNDDDKNTEGCIEIVTSPNNPDGSIREEVVVKNNSSSSNKVIHDLAYYWPHYTPITHAADHDLMYFTFSKSTGHAGSRIGWALVKDKEVAKKMTKFIELSSIGVSKDSQFRAAKIMQVISDEYQDFRGAYSGNFFEYAQNLMAKRWEKLRNVVAQSEVFSLPEYPQQYCCFFGEISQSYPAFAWLKCEDEKEEDCEIFLRGYKIIGRSGRRFGVESRYARLSMLCEDDLFDQLLERLSSIKGKEMSYGLGGTSCISSSLSRPVAGQAEVARD